LKNQATALGLIDLSILWDNFDANPITIECTKLCYVKVMWVKNKTESHPSLSPQSQYVYKFGNVMIFVGMLLHDAEVERQKQQLCRHTYWSFCFCQEITGLMIFTPWVANAEASLSGTKPHRWRHD